MRKLTLVLFLFVSIGVSSHPWKPDHYVIVDTDCGFDDFRTLNLLLASPNIRVLAITVSDGVTNAFDGYRKVKDLLVTHQQEGILVGVNNFLPDHVGNIDAKTFAWGNYPDSVFHIISYRQVLNQISEFSSEPLYSINLASMNTINKYLDLNPEFATRIKSILHTGSKGKTKAYNVSLDFEGYMNIRNKSVKRVELVLSENEFVYSNKAVKQIQELEGAYPSSFSKSFGVKGNKYSRMLYDEWLAIYLTDTALWDNRSSNAADVQVLMEQMLQGKGVNSSQVFMSFPTDSLSYMSDIRNHVSTVISKFGRDEWMSCVLTNELHRHVGVYALIGAKMGTRAKEYFGAGVDEMKVVSWAGSNPPISCLNDGLQVSTGATLGHGLMHLSSDSVMLPKATFEYLGQKIQIQLKPEYSRRIYNEVHQLTLVHDLNSNTYWDLVRSFALNCWFNWDRHQIFIIKTLY